MFVVRPGTNDCIESYQVLLLRAFYAVMGLGSNDCFKRYQTIPFGNVLHNAGYRANHFVERYQGIPLRYLPVIHGLEAALDTHVRAARLLRIVFSRVRK